MDEQNQQVMDQDDIEEEDDEEHEDGELEIEGGGQQIEEDDFPTEQEMID